MTATQTLSRFGDARRAMIDSQLRTSGVTAPAVLARMSSVAREGMHHDDRGDRLQHAGGEPFGDAHRQDEPEPLAQPAADAAVRPLDAAVEPLDDSVEETYPETYPVTPAVIYEVRPNWMLTFVCVIAVV